MAVKRLPLLLDLYVSGGLGGGQNICRRVVNLHSFIVQHKNSNARNIVIKSMFNWTGHTDGGTDRQTDRSKTQHSSFQHAGQLLIGPPPEGHRQSAESWLTNPSYITAGSVALYRGVCYELRLAPRRVSQKIKLMAIFKVLIRKAFG